MDEAAYVQISDAIARLASEGSDEPHSIDAETAQHAIALCDRLRRHGVRPPQIFPHGGDALEFVWSHNGGRRFVSTDGDRVRVRDYSPTGDFIQEWMLPVSPDAMGFLKVSL